MIYIKKITISIVIFFVIFLQMVPKTYANPVTFAEGFDPLKYLAAVLLLGQGLKVTSENAINAIATDFVSNISALDKDKLVKSITTGYITVSPSMAILLKNYVNEIPKKNGTIINYRNANMVSITQTMTNLYWDDVFVNVNLKNLNQLVSTNGGSLSTVYLHAVENNLYVSLAKNPENQYKAILFVYLDSQYIYRKEITTDTVSYSIDIKPTGTTVFVPGQVIETGKVLLQDLYKNDYTDISYVRGSISYTVDSADYAIDDLYPNDLTNRQIAIPIPSDGTAIDSLNDLVGKNYRDLSISAPMAGDVPATDVDFLSNIWVTLSRFFDLSIPVNWQPMQAVGTVVTNKFPFSLPWDIARGVQGLEANAERPRISGTWNLPTGPVQVDIVIPEWMDPLFTIVRGGVVVLFVVGLIYAHARLMGGQK